MRNFADKAKILVGKLSQPRNRDKGKDLFEYETKMVLVVITAVSFLFSLIAAVGWLGGLIPSDTLLIFLLLAFIFIIGWLLANAGLYRLSSLLPPLFLLTTAIYGTLVGGIDAPAMLIYVLAIIMVSVLRGIRFMYWTLGFSMLAYLSLGLAQRFGWIQPLRSGRTAFFNRITIVLALFVGIALLIHFLVLQFRRALTQAQTELDERKKISVALEESEKKYRELVENANSIILKTNEKGEITFFNEFAETFFGYSEKEILGRHLVGTILPEKDSSGKDMRKLFRDVFFRPEEHQTVENENRTRNDRRVWVNWTNKQIRDESGTVSGFLCVGNDVTETHRVRLEREQMQNQLLQAQKMEAIGRLTSGFAHDFNNILGGIMGSLSLLDILVEKKGENEVDRQKMKQYLQIALDSSKKASQLIRQLLLLSRKQDIKAEPVNLNRSISHVVDICRNSFPKSVHIQEKYGDKALMVMADSTMIEQVLLNFFINASDAMTVMRNGMGEDGGTLDISADTVVLTGDNPAGAVAGKYVMVSIGDTGVGMDEDTVAKIFEPFFSYRKNDKGTGLGLSMAQDFIRRLGGFIEVNSEIDAGSMFRIFLPRLPDDAGRAIPEDEEKRLMPGQGKVLVIDDEKDVLKVACESLTVCGYEVFCADNGVDGIELFRRNWENIHAVLLDVSMPGMTGDKVIEKLKKIDPSVKVMMSSGFSYDKRAADLSFGEVGFLQKPYTAQELSQRIAALIGKA